MKDKKTSSVAAATTNTLAELDEFLVLPQVMGPPITGQEMCATSLTPAQLATELHSAAFQDAAQNLQVTVNEGKCQTVPSVPPSSHPTSTAIMQQAASRFTKIKKATGDDGAAITLYNLPKSEPAPRARESHLSQLQKRYAISSTKNQEREVKLFRHASAEDELAISQDCYEKRSVDIDAPDTDPDKRRTALASKPTLSKDLSATYFFSESPVEIMRRIDILKDDIVQLVEDWRSQFSTEELEQLSQEIVKSRERRGVFQRK